MKRIILIHFGELALKGKNRGFFEQKLIENIKKSLEILDYEKIEKLYGRLLIKLLTGNLQLEIYRSQLKNVFGIANFAFAWEVEDSLLSIKDALLKLLKNKKFDSFAIRCQRGNKAFPLTSQEVNQEMGAFVLKNFPQKNVNLEKPDLKIFIEIAEKKAFIYFKKYQGAGGLPAKTGGRLIALLSAGIDSPVAAWKMIKRGAEIIFLHFHAYPFTPPEAQDTVKHLVRELNKYHFSSKLYLVNLGDIQKAVIANASEKLRTIFYRRAMFKIAEAIAEKENALGIVTGESLGQVASQTLENMRAVEEDINLPIYRPNIGSDKNEIIEIARKIDTYELSIRPYPDCCAYMTPKHPETKAVKEEVLKVEKKLRLAAKIKKAFKTAEIWKI